MTKIKTHTCRAGSMGRGVYSRSWISWTLSDEWRILYYVTVCRTNINSYLLQPISLMNAKYNLRSEFTHCITSLETKIQKACVGPPLWVRADLWSEWTVAWTMVGFVTPDQVCILCRAPGKPLSQHGTRYAVSKWGDTSAAYTGVQNKWKLYPDSLAPVIK